MPLFGPPNVDKMKAKGDVKGLIKAFGYQKDPTIRQSASSALVEMGPETIQPLINALKDKDQAVGEAASDTLVKMGQLAVDPLIKAITDRQADDKAIKVLKEIGDQAVSKAVDQLIKWFLKADDDCKHAASALAEVGPPAVEGLTSFLNDLNLDQKCTIKDAMALMLAYNSEKVPHYNDLMKKIIDRSSQGIYLRGLAAGVLGKIGDSRAVDPLVEILETEDDLTRWLAAGALFSIGDDRAAEALVTDLADEDLFVTGTGLVWLLIGDGLTLKPLLDDLTSENIEIKQKAVETLKKLGWNKQ